METEVTILKQDDNRGKVKVLMKSEKQNKTKLISDFAIIATTVTAFGLMNFQPPLSYSKKTALDFLFYFGSGMVSIGRKKLITLMGICIEKDGFSTIAPLNRTELQP